MTVQSTSQEHLLTVVEPTPGGDSTLALANDTISRGGQASVVVLVTDQVQRDIADFARAENLDRGEAEARALDQFDKLCIDRVGAEIPVSTGFGKFDRGYVGPDVTAIAVPERLMNARSVRKLSKATGLPVVVAPQANAA